MAAPEFPFIPDWAAKVQSAPVISEVGFGDGYSQCVGKGINNDLEKIALTFSGRTNEEADAICGFFRKRNGHIVFTARIGIYANSPIKKYRAKTWEKTFDCYGSNTVTTEFEEVP